MRRGSTAVVAAALLAACGAEQADHERAIPWSLGGQWLVADLHTHTRYSDGALTPDDLVGRALMSGCDVLAITDHGDAKTRSVNPAFFSEIAALRRKYPDLVLLTGLEWNVPPYRGREHMNVLVDPNIERRVLPRFKALFEGQKDVDSAAPALAWLADSIKEPAQRVLVYNHPSRHVGATADRIQADLAAWRSAGGALVGFEGAPGHQRGAIPSGYPGDRPAQDRWDPVAAQVGGVWDRLLAGGTDLWGAFANSDFHNDTLDREPCSFSRTYIQVPERTPAGVLKALRAGTFWGGHGKDLRHLSLTVNAPGLKVPAGPGEVIRYRAGGQVVLRVVAERSATAKGKPLRVELIGNCWSGRIEARPPILLGATTSEAEMMLDAVARGEDGSSCYVRARVRSSGEQEDFMAYTNPIRIRVE